MPANRPGRVVYATNDSGGTLDHGQAVQFEDWVGVATKQVAAGWDSVVADHSVIEEDEQYALTIKGKVLVDFVTGFAKGDGIYITDSNVLTETQGTNAPYGYVTEAPGERGTPAGKCWIDLDFKPPAGS